MADCQAICWCCRSTLNATTTGLLLDMQAMADQASEYRDCCQKRQYYCCLKTKAKGRSPSRPFIQILIRGKG